MMNSMKILIVHPSLLFFGGAEAVVVHLAHELKHLGAEVSILTSAISDDVKTMCQDIPLILPDKMIGFRFTNPGFFSGLRHLAEQVFVLRRLLNAYKSEFDIIHVHNFPATWAVALAGIKRRAVWMCNEPPELWNRERSSLLFRLAYFFGFQVDRLLVRRSIAKICVSDEINGKRARLRYGLEPEITPYGIDGVFFADTTQDDPRVFKKFGLPDGFMLVQVGTVTLQKNQRQSISVLSEIGAKIPNALLVLAGPVNEAYRNELNEDIKRLGLKHKVFFLGYLSPRDIRALYRKADVALFPVKTQGGWLAPYEALCAGAPVIVSESMGASWLIKQHGLGIATSDYTQAVLEVEAHRNHYREMSKSARTWILENLTWENFAQRHLEICESLCH